MWSLLFEIGFLMLCSFDGAIVVYLYKYLLVSARNGRDAAADVFCSKVSPGIRTKSYLAVGC